MIVPFFYGDGTWIQKKEHYLWDFNMHTKKRRKNTIKQDFNIKDFKQINCNSSSFKTTLNLEAFFRIFNVALINVIFH